MNRIDVILPSVLLTTLLVLLVAGCVEKSQELSSAEREQLSEFVKSERPSPEHELGISFENKVELIGYDVEPAEWKEGEQITVTWYWHAKQALEEGWLLFTHIADASGNNRLNSDGDSVVRRLYQPGRWKAGEYVMDRQQITLPDDWNSPRATLYLGVWNGPHRLQVTEGPNDGENRARALTVDVEESGPAAGETPQPAVPTLRASRAEGDMEIDGKLEEEAWSQASATGRFVNTLSGGTAEPRTTAKVLWDDENLYVAFEVADDFLKSDFDERDDHLWEQDAVELMIAPGAAGQGYFELQVSPAGEIFDTRYEGPRQPGPHGHVDWNADVEVAVETRGTLGDDEADEGYTVEMALPWASLRAGESPAEAPSANDTWRMNFFVMDARQEGERAAAWSAPRTGDFHILERFGRVVFVDGAAEQGAQAGQAVQPGKAPQLQLPPGVMDRIRQRAGDRGQLQGAANPTTPRAGEMAPVRPGMTAMEAATPMAPTAMDGEE